MAKRYDKQSMAQDYIAQVEWENTHPLDKRGRPQAKYQPNWKYKKVSNHAPVNSTLLWVCIVLIALLVLGFFMYIAHPDDPGTAAVGIMILLSFVAVIYLISQKRK